MSKESEARSSGVTWLGLLGLLFIGLKIGGVITWSWWWVTAPLWAGWAIILGLALILATLKTLAR